MKTPLPVAPPAARSIYYPQTAGHLNPEKLRQQFERLGRNDPIWQALMQLLQQRLTNAVSAAAQREENAPGRLEEILDFQRELASLRDMAPKPRTGPRS